MSLGYLFGGGVGTEPHGLELYRTYEVVRAWYEQVSAWTGLTVGQILEDDLPTAQEERQSVGTVREAALAIGVHEVLASFDLRPAAIGGLSLGAMTASCLAGSLGRRELFELLAGSRDVPEPPADEPPQGIAIAFGPAADGTPSHPGADTPGVYLAGDFGPTADGTQRIMMLAGRAEALGALAAEVPPGTVVPLPGRTIAVHTPLRRPYRDFMAPRIDAIPFADPAIPLLSCLEPKVLRTAADVRDLFQRNSTDPISLVDVYTGMREQGVRLGLVMGPSIPEGILAFPFPVVHVERPEHIEQALTTAYELGIDLTGTPALP
ncbi:MULTISPECIES: malonyl transferase [Kitasatospora]|uniref:Malonyl transferase n=1 Tax=Kitasatospora setae (strain ATCC 33774 / DSM 43861 / JCM 3304 / KCC A-0304 / NBRC 14216 / KM-6054) TaxID=452652 RepID=E4NJG4_KITSK|nr:MULTISPECIES: malonyl transferase [Kitasatospora]BAJ33112.1 malonyl transferase [Kitasatospora setae KM-6054]